MSQDCKEVYINIAFKDIFGGEIMDLDNSYPGCKHETIEVDGIEIENSRLPDSSYSIEFYVTGQHEPFHIRRAGSLRPAELLAELSVSQKVDLAFQFYIISSIDFSEIRDDQAREVFKRYAEQRASHLEWNERDYSFLPRCRLLSATEVQKMSNSERIRKWVITENPNKDVL